MREIAANPAITDIAMTTNGILLSRLAEPLAQAGLKRINVSIDTLDPERFKQITRGGGSISSWKGSQAAEAAGLTPIKLNAVVVRGQNDHEVAALAGLAYEHPWQVRFIEVMPFEGVDDVAFDFLVPTAEVMARIEERWGTLTPDPTADPVDPARPFVFPNARGSVGFISAMTDAFCATCNRMRLTADGKLRLCLLRDNEVDLLSLIRSGASDDDVRLRLREAVWEKPWGHGVATAKSHSIAACRASVDEREAMSNEKGAWMRYHSLLRSCLHAILMRCILSGGELRRDDDALPRDTRTLGVVSVVRWKESPHGV